MSAVGLAATCANVASATLGLISSIVLLVWALKLGPLQRTLAASDAVAGDSPLREVADLDAVAVRTELAELLRREARYLGASAILLGLSFLAGLIGQFL